ncbi:hypothetical protein APUTEX25_005457 [Auxenochlorella protothecoides]|uniref:Uncharacterized protein n=1 Tax=Auxenochlorella protothecoides TaxID=3075 RepID=A0A3M7KZ50_AUXPR|nr:hypothetical protein APUTEX25_005457 [Auxenochlorella protothecoides]|eukprot:RMZ55179.1 hypothetical protein APUTEX25_005457 [Auxenochlorella protothecoides]
MHDLVGAGGVEPVDLLVLLASTENDLPKLEELVAAGADLSVKVTKGAEYSQVVMNMAPEAISRPLATVCDPYLNLFRGIIPPLGGTLDLSPILAFVALDVITNTASAIPAEVDAQGQMVTMPAPRWKAGMNAAGRKITSLASGLSL